MEQHDPLTGVVRPLGNRAGRIALLVAALAVPGWSGVGAGSPPAQVLELELSQVVPSPEGRWVAVQAAGAEPREYALWLVDLESGIPRPLPDHAPTGAAILWVDGALRVEVADARRGRREMRWLDPATGDVLRAGRGTPLLEQEAREASGMGWARPGSRNLVHGRRVTEVEWLERGTAFAVSDHTDLAWQITRAPGLVFFATSHHGVTRVNRWDMTTEWNSEVTRLDGDDAAWRVAPDGQRLWVADDERAYVVDALEGDLVAGPWRSGVLSWLESAGSRFLLLDAGGHHYVIDVDLDRELHLGPSTAHVTEVFVLPGDRLVVRRDDRLDLLDRDGALEVNLIPGRPLSTAAASIR